MGDSDSFLYYKCVTMLTLTLAPTEENDLERQNDLLARNSLSSILIAAQILENYCQGEERELAHLIRQQAEILADIFCPSLESRKLEKEDR